MATIWQKQGQALPPDVVQAFTTGNDPDLDQRLAQWDCIASAAHAAMLAQQNLLAAKEAIAVAEVLEQIAAQSKQGPLPFQIDDEDIHTYLERILTEKLGETGKRIHAGRSRNDQVLTALKLYCRHQLLSIVHKVEGLSSALLTLAKEQEHILLPGFTHTQVAMPSSAGMWFAAYAEALAEELGGVFTAYRFANRNPLGSAAGFGSSMPLDRWKTTNLLAFDGPVVNPINAQLGRGRLEWTVTTALAGLANVINRLADDVIFFNSQPLGILSMPASFTTGSSIMPQKRNPDVFELIRGHCNLIKAAPNGISMLLSNQLSGYHRDGQLLKAELIRPMEALHQVLDMLLLAVPTLQFQEGMAQDPRYSGMYAVDKVNELVQQGMPFREAYLTVGAMLEQVTHQDMAEHKVLGGLHNLGLEHIAEYLENQVEQFPLEPMERWLAGFWRAVTA